jgi:hypothetical protein
LADRIRGRLSGSYLGIRSRDARVSVGRDLGPNNDALVGCTGNRDRDPCDRTADPSGASRMGEGRKPLAIRLVGALTREVEGEEKVLGLHGGAPAWPAGWAGDE